MGFHALREEQPDLFAHGAAELAAEIERHGGGTPPRYIAPDAEEVADQAPYSPVRFAEELRAAERLLDVVPIRVIPVSRFGELAERLGRL